jgi:hypothetical protein
MTEHVKKNNFVLILILHYNCGKKTLAKNYFVRCEVLTVMPTEQCSLLGCNNTYSDGSLPTFLRNILPPPSGSTSKTSKHTVSRVL